MTQMHTQAEVAGLLSQNIGIEKATDLVSTACAELGIAGTEMSRDQCLAVLEHLSGSPGLVGIAARFAKSRAILRWPA